jgi:putative sporulation protein YyaC
LVKESENGKRNVSNSRNFRIPFDAERAAERLADCLDIAFQDARGRQIAIVCVGTDRSTGDAFGPIIGTKLSSVIQQKDVSLYGTLDEPVHAVNLAATLDYIRSAFSEVPYILAIDACLGRFDHVGHVILEPGPLKPGAGVKKSLPEFGDYTLTGVVNVSGFMEYFVLQNTRLGIVMRMTDVVVEALKLSLFRYQTQRNIGRSANA